MFDFLPLDVIKYKITPFVVNDYFARMGINSMLAPVERMSTPLRKNATTELHITIILDRYNKMLSNTKILSNMDTHSKRGRQLMAAFNCVINNPLLLKYHIKFRSVITKKAEEHSDPNFSDYELISEDEKNQLVLNAKNVLEVLKNNAYVSEISSSVKNKMWSPIDSGNKNK